MYFWPLNSSLKKVHTQWNQHKLACGPLIHQVWLPLISDLRLRWQDDSCRSSKDANCQTLVEKCIVKYTIIYTVYSLISLKDVHVDDPLMSLWLKCNNSWVFRPRKRSGMIVGWTWLHGSVSIEKLVSVSFLTHSDNTQMNTHTWVIHTQDSLSISNAEDFTWTCVRKKRANNQRVVEKWRETVERRQQEQMNVTTSGQINLEQWLMKEIIPEQFKHETSLRQAIQTT